TAQANTRFVPTSRYTPVTAPSFQGFTASASPPVELHEPPRPVPALRQRCHAILRRGPAEAKTRMLSSTTPRSLYRPCRLVKPHVYRYWAALIPASSGPRGGRGP